MSIKLVAIDMDGTLLNSKKEVPADFEQWVIDHPEIVTVLASGRQFYRLVREFSDINDKLTYVAENGTMVVKDCVCLYQNEIDPDKCRAFVKAMEGRTRQHLVLCGINAAYVCNVTEEQKNNILMYFERLEVVDDYEEAFAKDHMIKMSIYEDDHDAAGCIDDFMNLADIAVILAAPEWIDIINKDANKGEGIKVLQQKLGIKREECMAFGDYMNDYEMMSACEESYCMANGCDELKAVAKYITASNDEDGVMRVLRTL